MQHGCALYAESHIPMDLVGKILGCAQHPVEYLLRQTSAGCSIEQLSEHFMALGKIDVWSPFLYPGTCLGQGIDCILQAM